MQDLFFGNKMVKVISQPNKRSLIIIDNIKSSLKEFERIKDLIINMGTVYRTNFQESIQNGNSFRVFEKEEIIYISISEVTGTLEELKNIINKVRQTFYVPKYFNGVIVNLIENPRGYKRYKEHLVSVKIGYNINTNIAIILECYISSHIICDKDEIPIIKIGSLVYINVNIDKEKLLFSKLSEKDIRFIDYDSIENITNGELNFTNKRDESTFNFLSIQTTSINILKQSKDLFG